MYVSARSSEIWSWKSPSETFAVPLGFLKTILANVSSSSSALSIPRCPPKVFTWIVKAGH